ncbi:MAG: T9SS type A sorting domain-containing protein [Bacteroidetes bacterium]|nr:MAG: T9SS type A sorting domain-containing protein [Bacteroidota bacterium]
MEVKIRASVKYLIIFLIIISYLSYGSNYESQTIVVKLRNNFPGYEKWIKSDRSGEIEEFIPILGHNISRGYISNSNIMLLQKRSVKIAPQIQSRINTIPENISKICIVKYESELDPVIVSKKIAAVPGIKYAEPLYEHHITDNPNDSLVKFESYLDQIKVFNAWDSLDTNNTVIIGIIDTGVDYLHEDLSKNLFINSGETGVDGQGNDKKTNNIDDDSNGFIDDWRGWDFSSDDNFLGDNEPLPGNEHGTHVAGICAAVVNNGIGVAGVAKKVKFLPVKVAPDGAFNTSVTNGYDGIVYATGMGADIINCSWGSSSKSEAEQEIIDAAVGLGSVVIAAAGNDNRNIAFYPSSHENVLSVAAVDTKDKKASFSNFDNTIDVSAPGVDILSTLPGNSYGYLSGTSMATPVVSGVAALVKEKFPKYKPIQIMQQIKETTDNIDTLNPGLTGLIGTGRVNAFKAVTSTNLKSVLVKSYEAVDNNDDIFDRGDTIRLNLTLLNVLNPIHDGWLRLNIKNNDFIILKDNAIGGSMASLEVKNLTDTIVFIVPDNIPSDSKVILEFRMYDDTSYCNSEYIEMTFRPTYRTMNANNLTVTFNNVGNIGYNDYPNNNQGEGFKYKDSPNLLFEGALMVGTSSDRLSNVARGLFQYEKDVSFKSDDIFNIYKYGDSLQEGFSDFYDLNSIYDAGVTVNQKVYQYNDSGSKNFIYVIYDIINTSGYDTDSLFAALFLDWDIGPSGTNNYISYDNQQVFGYAMNARDNSYPLAGVSLLSTHKLNFYAIDNGGSNIGIWDGFTRNEKWATMSSGISRKYSSITDASMVIGAGPIKLMKGDTTRVTFSLFAGNSLVELENTAQASREKAISLHFADSTFNRLPQNDTLYILYPNPAEKTMRMDFGLTNSSYIKIEVIDIQGKIIEEPVPTKYFSAGFYTEFIPVQTLSQGRYYLKFTTEFKKIIEPFEVVR